MAKLIRACTVIASLAVGSGCSWFREKPVDDGFRESRATQGVRVNRSGSLDHYRRFTVDEVEVRTVAGVAMDAETRGRIAEQFRRELVVRLADGYEVVAPPGAGVLRLRVVVSGVRPGPGLGLGDAWVASQVSDSLTDTPLLFVIDTRPHRDVAGSPLASDWEAARDVMLSWADALDAEIERVGR